MPESNNSSEATAAETAADEKGTDRVEVPPIAAENTSHRFTLPRAVISTIGVLAVLLMAYIFYKIMPLLLLFFISLLIATAIEPVVNWLRRGPFNRSAGILIVYTLLFIVLAAIGYLIISIVVSEIGQFTSGLQKTVATMRSDVKQINSPFLRDQAASAVDALSSIVNQVQSPNVPATETEKVQAVTQTTLTFAEAVLSFITIFVVAFYWLTERTLIKRSVMTWFPASRANRIRRVWDDIEVKVGGWVRGQLTLMGIVGLISATGYFFLGIDYWPALALFIAIAEAIPLVGPYIGTAPAVLVALTQADGGISKALLVVVFAVGLQLVEGNVLVPRIMKNSVGISPLTVIVSILIGSTLAGLAGAFLAVPIAGSLQVIVTDLKAAHDSDQKLAEATEAAAETRRKEGEMVVAVDAKDETATVVPPGIESVGD